MIRMGRGHRTDEPETTPYQPQPTATPSTLYAPTEAQPGMRAQTESDSMARDIKEGRLSGFVGHGTTLTGETQFHAMLRVDGHLVGSVSSEAGTLIIGNNGQVDANISVAAAMVNGEVRGDILATEKLQLGRTARVMGNISSPRLIIEEGAILEGSCSMLKALESQQEEATTAPEPEQSLPTIAAPVVDDDDSTSYLFDHEDEGDTEEQADAASV